uniref:Membrane-spanning 4-domains subfamily A member 4A-like n=1 Tax=Oncorhynchus tshawytscha TaxID=74940 RepID=A0A8C8FZP8_ONCTS
MFFSDEEAVPGAEGPLVAVTFQRTPHKKQKYLESEPKALGVTQIALSVFYISSVIVMFDNSMFMVVEDLTHVIGSVFVIIAGSLAIAAQNLHLPTLKACLGMQVVACVASVINLIFSVQYVKENITHCSNSCQQASTGHYLAELVLINTALIAISVTLSAYCCKVVNCCSPGQRMPVITVQVPPAQQ